MPGNNKQPVRVPPEIKETHFRISPPTQIGNGSDAIRSREVTSLDINNPGTFISTEVHLCADCNRVMHKVEEVGGVCGVCGQFLCVESAKLLCDLCGRCMCREHSTDTGKGRICSNHGWLRTIAHMFSSKAKQTGGNK
jgi:hypothetical protein